MSEVLERASNCTEYTGCCCGKYSAVPGLRGQFGLMHEEVQACCVQPDANETPSWTAQASHTFIYSATVTCTRIMIRQVNAAMPWPVERTA